MIEPVHALAFRRSTFQVALLMVATFGLYVFVWSYFARRACASVLEQEDQPLWKSIALIVPIFNFFMMFDLGKKIQGVQWRADAARVDRSLPWIALSFFAFTVVGRLKTPAAFLGVLDFVPIALMQQRLVRAQVALLGDAAVPTRLRWLEWVVLVFGGAVWVLTIVGMLTPGAARAAVPGEPAWLLASIALAAAMLAYFGFTSRRTIAQGRAMHADPAPNRIAPYA